MSCSHGFPRGLLGASWLNSTTTQVHRFANLATSPTVKNLFFRYSTITSFSWHCPWKLSFLICFRRDIYSMDLSMALIIITSHCSSFFIVVHVQFVHKSASRMLLLMRLTSRDLCFEHTSKRNKRLLLRSYTTRDFSIHDSAYIYCLFYVDQEESQSTFVCGLLQLLSYLSGFPQTFNV